MSRSPDRSITTGIFILDEVLQLASSSNGIPNASTPQLICVWLPTVSSQLWLSSFFRTRNSFCLLTNTGHFISMVTFSESTLTVV